MTAVFRLSFWLACTVVTVLSLLPSTFLDSGVFNWWDKAQHALAFLTLGLLGLSAYPAFALRVLLGLALFAGVIELVQAAVIWRTGDLDDWLADLSGLGLAGLLRYSAIVRNFSS